MVISGFEWNSNLKGYLLLKIQNIFTIVARHFDNRKWPNFEIVDENSHNYT